MDKPTLTIVIPVYNVAQYLPKCIESILKQDYRDFELLLINDGSRDESLNICRQYAEKDPRIRVFNNPNQGVSASRNFGIDQARGTWLCFIDSDDWIESNHLSVFFEQPLTHTTLVSQGILFDFDGHKPAYPFFKYEEDRIRMDNIDKIARNRIIHNGCPCCKLFNVGLLRHHNIRFETDLSIHEDHCFVLEYLHHIDEIICKNSLSYHYMRRDIETLCSKKHPATMYLRAADILREQFGSIAVINEHPKHPYASDINNDFGVRPLLMALRSINRTNAIEVIRIIKQERRYIQHYWKTTITRRILLAMVLICPSRILCTTSVINRLNRL